MRIARFIHNDTPQYAFVQRDAAYGADYLIALDGYPLGGRNVKPTGERYPLDGDGIRLLAPVIPSKIYGLMRNYAQPDDEIVNDSSATSAQPRIALFTKPSTSVIGPDDPIIIPSYSHEMNFEPEVAVVIGRITRHVNEAEAMSHVLGFTCVNDVTLCDVARDEPDMTRAKGFDTACPLGPWIETELDWRDAAIAFDLNGETVLRGNTKHLIHSIPEQIAFISQFATLLPGDVILTGTPSAAGRLHAGDEAVVRIAGIGSLRNVVLSE